MNTKTRIFFYHQLSVMLKAGLPLLGALEDMSAFGHAAARHAAGKLLSGIVKGGTLSEQMASLPELFAPMEITAVKAGEMSGRLPETLARLEEHHTALARTASQLISGMIYPLLLLHLAAVVPAAPALITQGTVPFLKQALPILLLLYGGATFVYFMLFITRPPSALAPIRDRIFYFIPILGPLIRARALVRFLRTFVCLYEAGVNVPTAVTLAANACNNSYIAGDLMAAVPLLARGESLSFAFSGCASLPQLVISMLQTGEQSGHLDETLTHAATYMQNEVDTTTARIVQILPVLVYLTVALYIAYVVISFYAGYFSAINDAGNL